MDKAPDAFRTISEVASDLELPQHVLRFWESRFPQIRPMKRAGGRRYYRPDDVDLLRGIRHLLYGEGYTIRGVQRILREQGPKIVQGVWQPGAAQPELPTSDDRAMEEADRLSPNEAASTLFGLSQPARPRGDASIQAPASVPATQPGLQQDDLRKLQAALQELSECRRLIDTALAG